MGEREGRRGRVWGKEKVKEELVVAVLERGYGWGYLAREKGVGVSMELFAVIGMRGVCMLEREGKAKEGMRREGKRKEYEGRRREGKMKERERKGKQGGKERDVKGKGREEKRKGRNRAGKRIKKGSKG